MSSNNRPPRDLNSLLSDIRVPSDIDRCHWTKAFREHLRSLHQPDNEALLDFCITANVLRLKGEEMKREKWRSKELTGERIELLKQVGDSFFSENSRHQVALSNAMLREELVEALGGICEQSGEKEVEEAYALVWQARCDYKVWKGGLDRAYNAFLATKPSPGLTAVLLSIM